MPCNGSTVRGEVALIGTGCFYEKSLLFCLTAHVTCVEGGRALPALWWMIKDLSLQFELCCKLLAVITTKVYSVCLSSLSPADWITRVNLSDLVF